MADRRIPPDSYEKAWELLKARLPHKTSWGYREILAVMETIEALISYERSKRYVKKGFTYREP